MLSMYVHPGQRLELQAVTGKKDNDSGSKVYGSSVYDVISDDRLEVTMPMEQTKLILLPVDGEYEVYFYTDQGLYQCFCRIIDRYKRNNVYILVLELISNLRKYQRREYYRFSCALEMNARSLEEEEIEALEEKKNYLVPGLPLKRSAIVDISGGGIRFVANHRYEENSMIYCKYHLIIAGESKEYNLVGKVLKVAELENRKGIFEHRVQYVNINPAEREEIIKYIFEEERKSRQRNSKN